VLPGLPQYLPCRVDSQSDRRMGVMITRQSMSVVLVLTLVGTYPISLWAAAQQGGASISGTAKDQAKKPFSDYAAQARDVQMGQIAEKTNLDASGNFRLGNLQPSKYVVELVDRNGKVVCTEGPFDMTKQAAKDNVNISCSKMPAAWWVLGAAAAAGITAGVVSTNSSSPLAAPASASR